MIWTIASNYHDYPSYRELSWQMKYIKRHHYGINHQPSSILHLYTPVRLAAERQRCRKAEARVKHSWQQMTWPNDCRLLRLEMCLLTWTLLVVKLGVSALFLSGIYQKEPLMDERGRTLGPVSHCSPFLTIIITPSNVFLPVGLVRY